MKDLKLSEVMRTRVDIDKGDVVAIAISRAETQLINELQSRKGVIKELTSLADSLQKGLIEAEENRLKPLVKDVVEAMSKLGTKTMRRKFKIGDLVDMTEDVLTDGVRECEVVGYVPRPEDPENYYTRDWEENKVYMLWLNSPGDGNHRDRDFYMLRFVDELRTLSDGTKEYQFYVANEDVMVGKEAK